MDGHISVSRTFFGLNASDVKNTAENLLPIKRQTVRRASYRSLSTSNVLVRYIDTMGDKKEDLQK
jgi:hypothetical protein